MSTKIYKEDAIRQMTLLFLPTHTPSYNWLVEKGHRELIETSEFIKFKNKKSFKWLLDQKFFVLAAFINAIDGNKKAFRWLMENKYIIWAATANAVNKDTKAMIWLRKNNFTAYAELAQAIIEFGKTDNSDITGYYKGP